MIFLKYLIIIYIYIYLLLALHATAEGSAYQGLKDKVAY